MPFELLSHEPVRQYQATLYAYRHTETGLRHYHLATRDQERSFVITFPTDAMDDQGKAHILEHCVLQGSRRYPAADAFQAMTKRSLAPALNAYTSDDHTSYPFTTTDALDFDNLLSVYLDLVFSPLLTEKTFQQEGVRVVRTPDGTLAVDGVVYNEMKGALANRQGIAVRAVQASLFPDTPYAFEYGGAPAGIRTLTHAELVAFHRHHYHPAHAVAVTYGDVDLHQVQARLEEAVAPWRSIPAPPARNNARFASALTQPQRSQWPVPAEGEEDNHSLVMAWALPPGPAHQGLVAWFLFEALAGSDASPVLQAMSNQGFGRPGWLSMAEDNLKNPAVWLSMDGLSEDTVGQAEGVIQQALEAVAQHSVSAEYLDGVFAAMEATLRQRGQSDGSLGAELSQQISATALDGFAPHDAIDLAPLMAMHAQFTDPAVLSTWIRKFLLENPAQAVVTLVPDPTWFEQEEARERAFLKALESQGVSGLIWQPDDATLGKETLPCVDLQRVSREPRPLAPHVFQAATPKHAAHLHVPTDTAGLLELGLTWDLSHAAPEEWGLLSLMASLGPALGCAGRTWEEAAILRDQSVVKLESAHVGRLSRQHDGRWLPLVTLAVTALERRAERLVDVARDTFLAPDFTDTERVLFLVDSELEFFRDIDSDNAAHWAELECQSVVHEQARWEREVHGRPAIETLERLRQRLEADPQGAGQWLDGQWQEALAKYPLLVTSIGGERAQSEGLRLAQQVATSPEWDVHHWGRPLGEPGQQQPLQALTGSTPVQFCYQVWAGPSFNAADAPALALACKALEQGQLYETIRRQGSAYWASAGLDDREITFSSFRDPRLEQTFQAFEAAVAWGCGLPLTEQALLEAKLGLLQDITGSHTPLQWAHSSIGQFFTGVSSAQRQAFREGLLDATPQQVQAAVQKWLRQPPLARWVFSDREKVPSEAAQEPAWPLDPAPH